MVIQMKNESKDSFDDSQSKDVKLDSDEVEANKKASEDKKGATTYPAPENMMEHERSGMVGNNAEQYEHSIEEPVNPAQPDLSDRPTNDPSVYPSDPHKGLTPNPLPSPPQVEPLPYPTVEKGDDEKKMSVEEILTRLLHIGNVAHHAGNQMDSRAIGHALRDLVHLMHVMISEK